jgi:gas vesicle protein
MDNDRGGIEYSENRNVRSVLTGLLVGGLIGAGVMFLIVPRSGKATRLRIQNKTFDLRDRMTANAVIGIVAQFQSMARQIAADVRGDDEESRHQAGNLLVK